MEELSVVTLALGKRLEKSLGMEVMELSTILANTPYLCGLVLPALKRSCWKKLILTENCIDDAGLLAFARACSEMDNNTFGLRVLWLDYNLISHVGIDALSFSASSVLSQNLCELYLGQNKLLGDEGVRILVEMFRDSPSLRKLGLDSVGITDMGAVHLSALFSVSCPILQMLALRSNQISDIGVDALIHATKSSSLTQVDVDRNRAVSPDKIRELKHMLKLVNAKWFRTMVAMCSARIVPRLGRNSDLRFLPQELMRRLVGFLIWPVKRTRKSDGGDHVAAA